MTSKTQFLENRNFRLLPRLVWTNARCMVLSLVISLIFVGIAAAQLQTLSKGNTDAQWRVAQIEVLEKQLADKATPENLSQELRAQRDWLTQWNPTAKLSDASAPATGTATSQSSKDSRYESVQEPILDPSQHAAELRAALFNTKKRPTAADTTALQNALMEHSGDIGLRQLQMHWLDQPRYRDDYWKEISQACDRVVSLLSEEKQTTETKAAMAHAYYRKARALAHSLRAVKAGSPEVAGAAAMKEEEQQSLRDALSDCAQKIESLVGLDHPEFFQLAIYVLRRDGWSGRALEVLERNVASLDESAYLAERKAIQASLNWAKPQAQTEARLTAFEGERRQLEINFE